MEPDCGKYIPDTMLAKVDLPFPDSPLIINIHPFSTIELILFKIELSLNLNDRFFIFMLSIFMFFAMTLITYITHQRNINYEMRLLRERVSSNRRN